MCGIRNSGQRFKWSKIRSKILNYQKFAIKTISDTLSSKEYSSMFKIFIHAVRHTRK